MGNARDRGSVAPDPLERGPMVVDNVDAWGHTQGVISRAQTLDILQLSIAIDEFSTNLHTEKPKIILEFDPNTPLDSRHRRNINLNDKRIERSILEQVAKGVDVRIQLPRMSVDVEAAGKVVGIALAGAITGVTALLMLGGVIGVVLIVLGAIVVTLGLATLGGLLYAAIASSQTCSTRSGWRAGSTAQSPTLRLARRGIRRPLDWARCVYRS